MKPVARLFLLAVAYLACGEAAAEPLGRLFFTPERRAVLERQRQMNVQKVQTLEGSVMSLDGIVTRSSGKSTIWVNQRPQHENASRTGVTATVATKSPERAVLAPTDEQAASLRVGESINRGTREKMSGLGGGQVIVNRKP